MTGKLLSAVLIVRDEELVLDRCLSSVKDIVDELIVVDTGSVDRTKDIATRYGAKVFDLEWANDFSSARNYGLEKATGEWIFHIDADEEIASGDDGELSKLLRQKDLDAINISISDSVNGSVWHYLRIFRNEPAFRYINKIHEEIPFESKKDLKVATSNVKIIHYGYEKDVLYSKDKNNRNIEILESLIEGKEKSAKDLYYYGVEMKNAVEIELSNRNLEDAIKLNDPFYSALAYKLIAENYSQLNKPEEAIEILNSGIRVFPDFTDLRFLAGVNYLKLEKPSKAIGYFEDCMRKGQSDKSFPHIPEVGGVLPLLFYGFCLHSLREEKKAEKVFSDAIAALRNNADALSYLAKLLIRLNGVEKAKDTIIQLADLKDPTVRKALSFNFSDIRNEH